MDAGICSENPGSSLRILSTTSTVLVPGWRCTASTMARVSPRQLAILSFSTLSMTSPKSDSRTGAPFLHVTMRGLKAAASMSLPLACTFMAVCSPYRVPVGRLTLERSMASATSSSPTSRPASALGSSCTRTAYFLAPYTETWATPLIMEMRGAMTLSAYSLTVDMGWVAEDMVR
jgi:hypothetical protein